MTHCHELLAELSAILLLWQRQGVQSNIDFVLWPEVAVGAQACSVLKDRPHYISKPTRAVKEHKMALSEQAAMVEGEVGGVTPEVT